MKFKSKTKKLLLVGMALCILFGTLIGCSSSDTESQEDTVITSLDDLQNGNIGMQTGSSFVDVVEEAFPDATFSQYSTFVDLTQSLEHGIIDGFPATVSILAPMQKENPWMVILDEVITKDETAVVFAPNEKGELLCEQFNEFLAVIKEDGSLDEMAQIWFFEEGRELSYETLPAENGTVSLAMDVEYKPYGYYQDGKPVGFEVDLVSKFCEYYGYGLEVQPLTFSAILPSVSSGKYDIAASGFTYTPERAESVIFSDITYVDEVRMVVNGGSTEDGGIDAFLANLKESFEKTFIREDRWKLIVEGICTTLLITLAAAVLGTAWGFLLYMLRRTGNRFLNGLISAYSRLLAGTPMVVLLMILFYVVFVNIDIGGLWVAVIGFALTTGSFVCNALHLSVSGIDGGQREAALSLGYTENRAFFSVVLPQAMRSFMPNYKDQMVSLLKETAIVGYIAVQDLTKMSDIIRASTYEAFFPLIATAIIYFILTWGIAALVARIHLRMDTKKRKPETILKGVRL